MAIPDFIIDIRTKIGHDLLWLPVGTRRRRLLMVRRPRFSAWLTFVGRRRPL